MPVTMETDTAAGYGITQNHYLLRDAAFYLHDLYADEFFYRKKAFTKEMII